MSMSVVLVGLALVTKSNFPGHVHPDWSRYERCEVYADRVVVTQVFGGDPDTAFTSTEVKPLTLTDGVHKALAAAASARLQEKPNSLCDGPSTSVEGSHDGQSFTIFETGGCGSPNKQRLGAAARFLKELVDLHCPTTHDYHDEERR